jgi:hypothetical protein
MPFTADVERTIEGPLEAVFARFIEYPRWKEWMPSLFRPLRGPSRSLHVGDRLLVSIAGLPSVLTVEHVDAPYEVRWSGGVPGVLFARHTFSFHPAGPTSTRVRSLEPWTGLLTHAPLLASRLLRAAEGGGRGMLSGFDRWYAQQPASRAA